MNYKFLCCLFLICFLCCNITFSQGYFYDDAKQYLDYAAEYFMHEKWQEAFFYAEQGVNTDAGISDLWYIRALSADKCNKEKNFVVHNLESSLAIDNWIIFDKNNALLALSKSYLKTNNVVSAKKCLETISSKHFFEKSLLEIELAYLEKNILFARKSIGEKVNVSSEGVAALNVFLQYEPLYQQKDSYFDAIVAFILQNFDELVKMPQINTVSLLPYANFQQVQKFLTENKSSGSQSLEYLFALYAYNCLTFEEFIAFSQQFSCKEIRFSFIQQIMQVQSSFAVSKLLDALKKKGVVFLFDTNNDSYSDLRIAYAGGKITQVLYEKNQDGIKTWSLCLNEVQPTLVYTKNNRKIVYDVFPEVKAVKDSTKEVVFVDDSVFYYPIEFQEINIAEIMMIENPIKLSDDFSFSKQEKKIAEIHLKTTDTTETIFYFGEGILQFAEYFSKGKKEGILLCSDGKPLVRKLDFDYDGYFEITEKFSSEFSTTNYNKILFGTLTDFFSPIFLHDIEYNYNF